MMETKENYVELENDLNWLKKNLEERCYDKSKNAIQLLTDAPVLSGVSSYGKFIKENELKIEERAIFLLSLAPHCSPELLDVLIQPKENSSLSISEVGGRRGVFQNGIIPTVQTALFLLGGNKINDRLDEYKYFSPGAYLLKKKLISIEFPENGEPILASILNVPSHILARILGNDIAEPNFFQNFPGAFYNSESEWKDMVLSKNTMRGLEHARLMMRFGKRSLAQQDSYSPVSPGIKLLLYGPSGTGKSVSASLLAKEAGIKLFRVDISQLASRYIGETEKKFAILFEMAEKNEIGLFFDEADALFGKRAEVVNSHDRYANQEVSYLLQRIENCSGLILLATNMRSNIDPAFSRRFHSFIHFDLPDKENRLLLWRKYLPAELNTDSKINLESITSFYELSPAEIRNAAYTCSLRALKRNDNLLLLEDFEEAIWMEHIKMNKPMKSFARGY